MSIPAREEEWQASNEAEGIEPFVANLLEVFERDQRAAHAWAGRGVELADYAAFNNARRLNQRWPALSVVARTEDEPADETEAFLRKNVVEVEIEVKGAPNGDPNALAWELMRRVRAVKAMIKAGRVEDYTAGTESDFGGMTITISRALFASLVDPTKTIYTQRAVMTVTQELLEETQHGNSAG